MDVPIVPVVVSHDPGAGDALKALMRAASDAAVAMADLARVTRELAGRCGGVA